MATTKQKTDRAEVDGATNGAPTEEPDEAVLLEQTGGLLTALPTDSTADDWDMPALFRALKAGEVRLPLTEAEERRFRRQAGRRAR
jgi:hypothetical protein